MVLHHHHRLMAALKHLSDRVMHLLHAFRIQVRSRFVEQQQSGMHGKHASQCQPLTLAAGQPTCGMIRAHVVQAHDVKGLTHPLPDGVSSEAEILAAESGIVTCTFKNRLGVRILHHQAAPAACRT